MLKEKYNEWLNNYFEAINLDYLDNLDDIKGDLRSKAEEYEEFNNLTDEDCDIIDTLNEVADELQAFVDEIENLTEDDLAEDENIENKNIDLDRYYEIVYQSRLEEVHDLLNSLYVQIHRSKLYFKQVN